MVQNVHVFSVNSSDFFASILFSAQRQTGRKTCPNHQSARELQQGTFCNINYLLGFCSAASKSLHAIHYPRGRTMHGCEHKS